MTTGSSGSASEVHGVSVWQRADGSLAPPGGLRGRVVRALHGGTLLKGDEAVGALEQRFNAIAEQRATMPQDEIKHLRGMVERTMPHGERRDALLATMALASKRMADMKVHMEGLEKNTPKEELDFVKEMAAQIMKESPDGLPYLLQKIIGPRIDAFARSHSRAGEFVPHNADRIQKLLSTQLLKMGYEFPENAEQK